MIFDYIFCFCILNFISIGNSTIFFILEIIEILILIFSYIKYLDNNKYQQKTILLMCLEVTYT